MSMFCYQCEQTMGGQGCSVVGVCGKDATTAGLMDLLCVVTQGVSQYAHRAAQLGARDAGVDRFVIQSLFTTVTNVNFDSERIAGWVRNAVTVRATARALYEKACAKAGKPAEVLTGPAALVPADSIVAMEKQAVGWGIPARISRHGSTIAGLEELVLYGLKGAAAYADHAWVLGKVDDSVSAFFHKTLDFLTVPHAVEEYLGMALAVGESNLKVMALLDGANTGAYGHPTPTAVRITAKKGKAILVSGHDLKDLHTLLELTKNQGINIYTHGEMLPAHGYPELKKYPHLVGNYGGAWQDQAKEFDAFPGAILMTTNCIQNPRQSYKARIFTTGLVGWPGVTHVANGDFGPVVQAALAAPGFAEDQPEKTILTGFGHQAVLGVADKVVAAVKSGAIKHFFLVGGCDGARPGRDYYTQFAESVPDNCVILTLACGKYRFNKLDFGNIGGIPRLLDIGQCNDAHSAIQIAVALANAFNTDVNSLPLSMVLSWYEQKAVAILLSLLHLGIKNIRLGPSLPAFVTPDVLAVLVKGFAIAPITTPEADLKAILGQAAA
jgi:hydroxylamine reductase